MKNLRLFSLALLGSAFFLMTSCGEDDDPVGPILTVNETASGSSDGSVTVAPGETLRFEWDARAGDADLAMFTIRVGGIDQTGYVTEDGNSIPYDIGSGAWAAYQDAVEVEASLDEGSTDYVFLIEDADGLSESETITVIVEGSTTELENPQAFTWEREGGTPATGLGMFGLKWTNNATRGGTEVMAIVTTDGATMVMLDPADWNDITTVEELGSEIAAAVDGGTTISEYTEVSAEQDANYNDVLGISYNNRYYMLHITDGTVTTDPVTGTTVTIMGDYKAEPQ